MTPLAKIEQGITNGDWQLVCDGFNKITNKNLQPPTQKPKELKSKKDFYDAILNLGHKLSDISKYSLEELKEIYMIHMYVDTEKVDTSPQKPARKPTNASPLYVSKPDKLLYIDKHVPVKVVADNNFEKIIEPPASKKPKRDKPKMVKARCTKCSVNFETLPAFTYNDNNEIKGLCNVCKESK